MSRRKNLGRRPQDENVPKEIRGWIFSLLSSKWFIVLILVLAGIIWYGFYATHTKEITGSDDREYASIARNVVHGKGIVRNFVYPVEINFFEKLPIPEFVHPPGYPLIIAGFFRLFGVSDFVALLPSLLSFFGLVLLLFFFAKGYLEIRTVTVAAVILIFNREILDMSIVALSEIVYTLFFLLFFVLFVKARSSRDIFIAGILLGASHLIRENIYPLLLPLLVYLYFYPDLPRWKKMVIFAVGFLIPVVPNMIRSLSETGSPFFSYGKFTLMAFTEKYPWLNVYRDVRMASLSEFLINEPGQFISKYLSNLVTAVEQIMSVSNPYVLAFFIVEMFYWKMSPEWKRIKMLFLFLLISQILFISLFTFTHRFFIPFLPMMILFASQGFLRISNEWIGAVRNQWKRRASIFSLFLFLILFMIPTAYIILKPGIPLTLDSKTPPFGFLISGGEAKSLNEFLKGELKEDQVVWTDLPEILEWEGNRWCGWLPTQVKMIYEIHKKIPVDAILLTSLRTPSQMEQEWKYLLFTENSLPLYRTVKVYKGRGLFAKLLIRDEKE